MFNGSRQSNNFTANAGGVGNTARVAISDVAFKNSSLDEVRAVTGHEIGHYVLKHTWYGILFYSISAIILFWIADRTFPWFARAFGESAALAEPRGIAVLLFMILRKEVIQPQVPLRLPCYDFTPVAEPTVVGCLPCGLAHHLRVNPTPMV